jgi:hypothetical protein
VGDISEANVSHPLSFALAKDNPNTKKLKKLIPFVIRILISLANAREIKIEKTPFGRF